MLKLLGIYATIITPPLFTMNSAVNEGISAMLNPINIWATILVIAIVPMASSLTTNLLLNRYKK